MTVVPGQGIDAQAVMKMDAEHVMRTYGRQPVVFVRGKGVRLWDADGREYLDFLAGIAVNGLGHAHPTLVSAISEQAGMLMHVSNLYHVPQQPELARFLGERGLTAIERLMGLILTAISVEMFMQGIQTFLGSHG